MGQSFQGVNERVHLSLDQNMERTTQISCKSRNKRSQCYDP